MVEERYSRVFVLEHVRPGFVADLLARVQVRWPTVPIFFAETRPLAEEWTYRFLGAVLAENAGAEMVGQRLAGLELAGELPAAPPTAAAIRTWAAGQGFAVADRGRVPAAVRAAYDAAHPS